MTQTATVEQITGEAEELFKVVMDLYSTVLDELEQVIKNVPDTETQLLNELNTQMQEIQSALEHDIGVFDEAIQSDLENLHHLKDQLKINDIYIQLKS